MRKLLPLLSIFFLLIFFKTHAFASSFEEMDSHPKLTFLKTSKFQAMDLPQRLKCLEAMKANFFEERKTDKKITYVVQIEKFLDKDNIHTTCFIAFTLNDAQIFINNEQSKKTEKFMKIEQKVIQLPLSYKDALYYHLLNQEYFFLQESINQMKLQRLMNKVQIEFSGLDIRPTGSEF